MTRTATLAEAFEDICRMEAPLGERLAAYAAKLRELNYPFAEAYDSLVARLMAGEVGSQAPGRGEPMPPFMLPSHVGRLVTLDDLLGRGPVVISLNRGHWCPFCKIELTALAQHGDAIRELGGEAVSIMPETQRYTRPLGASLGSGLVILSDIDNGYALSLGLVMAVGEKVRALLQGRGVHLADYQQNESFYLPLPATFVVGRDGVIIDRFVDPDFRRRMEPEDVLKALKSRPL